MKIEIIDVDIYDDGDAWRYADQYTCIIWYLDENGNKTNLIGKSKTSSEDAVKDAIESLIKIL